MGSKNKCLWREWKSKKDAKKSKIYCASSHYERKNSSEIPIEEVAQKTGAENE